MNQDSKGIGYLLPNHYFAIYWLFLMQVDMVVNARHHARCCHSCVILDVRNRNVKSVATAALGIPRFSSLNEYTEIFSGFFRASDALFFQKIFQHKKK